MNIYVSVSSFRPPLSFELTSPSNDGRLQYPYPQIPYDPPNTRRTEEPKEKIRTRRRINDPAPARRLRFVVNPQNFRTLSQKSLHPTTFNLSTESLLTIYLSSQHEVVSIRTKLSHRRPNLSTVFERTSTTLRLFATRGRKQRSSRMRTR